MKKYLVLLLVVTSSCMSIQICERGGNGEDRCHPMYDEDPVGGCIPNHVCERYSRAKNYSH